MKQRAFTLIELLVVVAIIALLISILLPSLKLARDQARDVVCRTRLGEVTRGHLYYAQEWRDCLPGNTANNEINGDRRIYDWLGIGSFGTRTQKMATAPEKGTIFGYLNDEDVYLCPTHRLAREGDSAAQRADEHRSSYTAPTILTGAPITLLQRVRYPATGFGGNVIPQLRDAVESAMPIILVEEDANWYLVRSDDSAWANWDQFTDRHRGFGGVGFVDGHAEHRQFPRQPNPMTAWNLLFELVDGRFISAGHYTSQNQYLGMGWLRDAPADRRP